MPRKRMIDPEFWSDEEIGNWSHSARLFYIGLWNFADDSGRFRAHSSLLKSSLFPYDDSVDIEALKKELGDKIEWYEVNGSSYGFIRNFSKHQRIDRPTESKLPLPPGFDEGSTSARRGLVPNIREVKRKEYNIKGPPAHSTRFVPPTVEEAIAFFNEKVPGNTAHAQQYHDFYTSKGWKVGSSSMKDWRAAARNWIARNSLIARGAEATPAVDKPWEEWKNQERVEPPEDFKKLVQDIGKANEEKS